MLNCNQVLDLSISGYTSDGEGVAHFDGEAIFVPGAIVGETVRCRIVNVGKTCAHAAIKEVLTASPHRIAPKCPHFAACGGCSLGFMDYEEELNYKKQRVLDALNRIGGQKLSDLTIHGASSRENYRNKVQFPVQEQNGHAVAGFYSGRTHRVVPIRHCLIQPPCADTIRDAVLTWMQQYHIRAYDEKTQAGYIRHIYVRRGTVTGEILVCIIANCKQLPQKKRLVELLLAAEPGITTIVFSPNTKAGNTVLGKTFETLYGVGTIEDILCGLKFRLSPAAFYQVNHDQAEQLYEKALEFADLHGNETVLDLYCGTGTITLCLAKKAKRAIGAEIIPQAIEDAKFNAKQNSFDNAEFYCMDAGQAALMLSKQGIRPDVITLDPPRKGISQEVIDAVFAMQPKRIVYVSCDPATLARDVKLFAAGDYQLQRVEAYDLFPCCGHVESICLITRTK